MPNVIKQLLPVPFVKGLSEREAPEYLAPGALITGENLTHPKTNTLSKRPGTIPLALTGPASVPSQTVTRTSGLRLGCLKNNIACIGNDAYAAAMWTHDEALAEPVFKDRVPEVYGFPSRVVAGGSGVVLDADTAVIGPWQVHVWVFGTALSSGAPSTGCDLYYQVENASTGEVLIGAQSIGQVDVSCGAVAPKLLTIGTTLILTFMMGATSTTNRYGVYATSWDSTHPTNPWTARAMVTGAFGTTRGVPAPIIAINSGAPTGNGSWMGVYDSCEVIGDTTTFLVVVNTSATSSPQFIIVFGVSVSTVVTGGGTLITHTTDISSGDPHWSTDGSTHNALTAIAIRGDATNNEIAIVYGWNTTAIGGGGTSRLNMQLLEYSPFGSTAATVVQLLGTPGNPHPTTSDYGALHIAMDRMASGSYKVIFSTLNAYENSDTGTWIASYIVNNSSSTLSVAANQPRITYGVILASRIIQRNGIGYVMGWNSSPIQGTYYLLADDAWSDVTSPGTYPMRLVGTFAPRQASGPAVFYQDNAVVLFHSLINFTVPHLVANPSGVGGDIVQTILSCTQGQATVTEPSLFTFDFKSQQNYQMQQLGENLGIAAATPSVFDGTNVFEFGMPYYPQISHLTASTITGANIPNGTYSYIAVYEKRDSRGVLHRSGRSPVMTITTTGTQNAVTLTVTTMGFTGREKATGVVPGNGPQGLTSPQLPTLIRIYRTTNAGSVFFCLDRTAYVTNGGSDLAGTAACYNTTGAPTVSIIDGIEDNQIEGNELVYDDGSDGTQAGSIVDNLCPPAFQCLITHQSRFFGVDGNNVWASKAFTDGEGSGFNEVFAFSVDDGPGFITALASMDEKLVIFKRDRLFYQTGLGPTDNSGSNDWSFPQKVSTDTGCVDWRSVVVTPQGVYFKSDAGLRLLTRDLQLVPVTNVEDRLTEYPAVSSAAIHPTQNRVLWTTNQDDTSTPRDGIGIDHDYITDTWLTQQFIDNTSQGQGSVSSVVANALVGGVPVATYHTLRADGTICRESPTSFFDGTAYVGSTVETAWIKGAAIADFARFKRMMLTWEALDFNDLSVYVAYDYVDQYYLLGTVSIIDMELMPNAPLCEQLFSLPRQRAEAVRFKIQDALPADGRFVPTTGAGNRLISMDLEVGLYQNKKLARVPKGQRS